MFFDIDFSGNVRHIVLADRAKKHDFGVDSGGFHPFAGNTFANDDSVDVGALRAVFPVNDFDLNELVDVHGVAKDP